MTNAENKLNWCLKKAQKEGLIQKTRIGKETKIKSKVKLFDNEVIFKT